MGVFRSHQGVAECEFLTAKDVIRIACGSAGDPRLWSFRFRSVLIDEATEGTEQKSLIPVVRSRKQLVFFGYHCEFGPVITEKAAAAGLG